MFSTYLEGILSAVLSVVSTELDARSFQVQVGEMLSER